MPMPRKVDEVKYCLQCGTQLVRTQYLNSLEDATRFAKRKYCNKRCSGLHHMKATVLRGAYHQRAKKFKKENCEACGTQSRLHVHHRNGDPSQNTHENCQTLCASCHLKWHWQNGKKPGRVSAPCKVCSTPSRKWGYCQKHGQRFKKYGDPFLTKIKRGRSFELVRETPG